jgi:hypothetical protein
MPPLYASCCRGTRPWLGPLTRCYLSGRFASRLHRQGLPGRRRTHPHLQMWTRFRQAHRQPKTSPSATALCPPRLPPLKIASTSSWTRSRRSRPPPFSRPNSSVGAADPICSAQTQQFKTRQQQASRGPNHLPWRCSSHVALRHDIECSQRCLQFRRGLADKVLDSFPL